MATSTEIASWIRRQRKLKNPNQIYLKWLRKQFTLTCNINLIKKDSK